MMSRDAIGEKFRAMGVRVRIGGLRVPDPSTIRVNVRRDRHGEFFDVRHNYNVDVRVLDVRARDRHLLLSARRANPAQTEMDSRFLCGRDERSWFVAAVPERADAQTVRAAKDALKPEEVWAAIRKYGVRPADQDKRWTKAFVRQGEWFFIPRPEMYVAGREVVPNEPIRRGAGKPHWCQFLHRKEGAMVYFSAAYPNGIPPTDYEALPKEERLKPGWRRMFRNAVVFAKGSVKHADHKTIWLPCWHRVVMNTETQAAAMRQVAFLD